MTVFWDAIPCSLAEVNRRFGGALCHHHEGEYSLPLDGYSKHLRNVENRLADCTAQHPKKESLSKREYIQGDTAS